MPERSLHVTETLDLVADVASRSVTPAVHRLSPADVVHEVAAIKQIMADVMKEGEHYGKVPGSNKPGLFQPGAQIIALTFRLGPRFRVTKTDLPGGHREFYAETDLYNQFTGQLVGMGVGLATTLETKWRYRSGPVTFTGRSVPREYWDLRQSEPQKAAELLGGRGYQTRKNPDTGFWEVVEAGERTENDNSADVFNTALKMASKRSFVHAVMNTTAAGEMFTTTEVDESVLQSGGERVNAETLERLRRRRDELGIAADLYSRQVSHYKATVDSALSQVDAEALLGAYESRETAW
jgi:hypothetical protein